MTIIEQRVMRRKIDKCFPCNLLVAAAAAPLLDIRQNCSQFKFNTETLNFGWTDGGFSLVHCCFYFYSTRYFLFKNCGHRKTGRILRFLYS